MGPVCLQRPLSFSQIQCSTLLIDFAQPLIDGERNLRMKLTESFFLVSKIHWDMQIFWILQAGSLVRILIFGPVSSKLYFIITLSDPSLPTTTSVGILILHTASTVDAAYSPCIFVSPSPSRVLVAVRRKFEMRMAWCICLYTRQGEQLLRFDIRRFSCWNVETAGV